jgi:homoserine dehydrogenase
MTFDLVLVGFGKVARRFVGLLHEQRTQLSHDYDVTLRIVGIATRRRGQVLSAGGLDARRFAARVAAGGLIGTGAPAESTLSGAAKAGHYSAGPAKAGRHSHSAGPAEAERSSATFIRDVADRCAAAARQRRLIVVETTTLDIQRGEPAIGHVRAALASGAHVVTANKGPAAFAYRSLVRAAERAGRRFLFEGAVMDGIPIFNLVRDTLPGVRVTGFRGVVNSTTNYMLTAMEEGRSYQTALAEMQARGIAEADPSLDVDGWDAAAKSAALANVLLDANVTPQSIAREGIAPETAERARAAMGAGRRLKLVVRGSRSAPPGVGLEELPADDLLASLEHQQNALILHTDLLGEFAIVQRGGDLTQTAYALLSDILTIAREITRARASRRSPTTARRGRSR